jgi:hypothetical protein
MSIKKIVLIDEVVWLIDTGSNDLQAKSLIFSGKLETVIGHTQTRDWKTSNCQIFVIFWMLLHLCAHITI